jgi:preprotein translocase subunit SecE
MAMSTVERKPPEQVKPAVRTGGDEGGGITKWWTNSRTFLTEVRNEMRRVTWPSRREVYATTVVVILTSTFFGLYLWGLDLVLDRVVTWIFRSFGAA